MDSIKIILSSVITFNLILVFFAIYLVKKGRLKQSEMAKIKRQQLLEQGKIIAAQENLLKAKKELLVEKEKLLEAYRRE